MKELICKIHEKLSNYDDMPLFVLRISLGLVFINAGYGKVTDIQWVESFFTGLQIPFPLLNAYLASYTEFIGGILMVLGLGTRFVSIPLAGVMVVALFTAHIPDIAAFKDLFKSANMIPWFFFWLFVLLICRGAGRFSLDHLICKKYINQN